jgi:hypothetical protein
MISKKAVILLTLGWLTQGWVIPGWLTLDCVAGVGASSLATMALASAAQGQNAPAQGAIAKRIGTIKSIQGNVITLAAESGPDVAVTVEPNARMLRLGTGSKDLKDATPVQLQDLQVGDTIRVRGSASDDGKSLSALEVLVITRAAVTAMSDQIRQDWQKRGLGGLVSTVDAANGTISISLPSLGGNKTVAVHISKDTIFRRYAPDSVKFEDAKPSTLQQIQAGDQLRARGTRSADGSEFSAEEVVTGSFRNIAGTIDAIDAPTGTIKVKDLLSKKTVDVRVTPDSQLHKIPAEAAQRFAMRFKAAMSGETSGNGSGGNSGAAPAGATGGSAASAAAATTGSETHNGSGGMHQGGGMGPSGGRPPDFQQMLNRMPSVTLADLHKGDALMMVTTQSGTAITLVSGVEPILEAAPSASQALMLAPWSLGGAPGGGDAGNP